MNDMSMEDPVGDGKLVELTYKVIDAKTKTILTQVEFPIGYVHGVNQILAPQVTAELEGRLPGDVIEVREKSRKVQKIVDALANLDRSPLPQWIEIDRDKFSGKVTAMPSRSDSSADIDEQLIVELYSK